MARRKTPATRKRGTITDPTMYNQDEHQSKIRKTEQSSGKMKQIVTGRDRLSNLPEELIVNILSLLDMEDAVKTGLLSKRWNKLWTQVDNIVYNKGNEENLPYLDQRSQNRTNDDDQWLSFIDSTLMKCTSKIKSFDLAGVVCLFRVVKLDKWIAHVIDKKVENLKLDIFYPAPDCLFQSSTITKLELLNLTVNTSTTVSLSALKSLLLEKVYIVNDSIEKILIGSPRLENLVLRHCNGFCRLNIMSPSVKMLELWNCYSGDEVFNIKAPWLQELKISGNFTFANCELVDVSSLLKATLTFHTHLHAINHWPEEWELNDYLTKYYDSWIPIVTKLLKSLSYVGELTIGSELIQVLLLLKLLDTPSKTLFRCKHLTIETCLWKFDLPGIACLLENTPHLESLLIKVVPFSLDPKDGFLFYQMQNIFQDEDQHLNEPSRKLLHLKNVKVEYCQMPCQYGIEDNQGGYFEFELVKYILKSAVVLEKLALCSPRGGRCSNSSCLIRCCSNQYVSRCCYKLIITIMSLTGNNASGWVLKRSDDESESEFVFSNYASLLYMAGSSSSSM